MNMIEAVKTVFKKYATFSGRAKRSEFWWFILFITIVQLILGGWAASSMMGMGSMMADSSADAMAAMGSMYSSPGMILSLIFSLVTLIPSLAVAARRLHDTGLSGWWQLLWLVSIIPLVGLVILIVMIVLFARKSQEGENKYG